MSDNPTVVFPEPGTVTLEDRDMPRPGPDEVLVRTSRSLVSTGTELTLLSGEYPSDSVWETHGNYPLVSGYSNVGTVVDTGATVEDVAADDVVASRTPHAAYVVADADETVPVPADVSAESAAFCSLAAISMNGVRRGEVAFGESVCIYGLGLIGQLTARFCRVAGARPVVGVDIATRRVAHLPDEPCVVGVDAGERDPVERLETATRGRLADVVFECTGQPDAVPPQFEALREMGRFVLLSSPRGETSLDLHDVCNAPSNRIVGVHDDSHPPVETPATPWTRWHHYELFFDLLAEGAVDVAPLVTHRVPSDGAPETYRRLLADRSDAMGVVIEWTDARE